MPLFDRYLEMPHKICVPIGASIGFLIWTGILFLWEEPIPAVVTVDQVLFYSVFGTVHGSLTGLAISGLGLRFLKAGILTVLLFNFYLIGLAIADPTIAMYWPIIFVISLAPNLAQGFLTWSISNLIATRLRRVR